MQLKTRRTTGEAHNVLGLGQPGLPIPHFYRQGPGPAQPTKPSLLSTGPGPARPPNPSRLSTGAPHFYRQGAASPATPNLSLLLALTKLFLACGGCLLLAAPAPNSLSLAEMALLSQLLAAAALQLPLPLFSELLVTAAGHPWLLVAAAG